MVQWKCDVDPEKRLKTKKWKMLLEQLGKTIATKVLKTPEMIDILSYDAFTVAHRLNDNDVLDSLWYDKVIEWFKKIKQLNDFLFKGF